MKIYPRILILTVFGATIFFSCKKEKLTIDYNIMAASTKLEDVQTAVDSAKNGDIVMVPTGTSTWNDALDIPDDKKITLRGSGSGNTIISSTSDEPRILIDLNQSGSRITEFGFRLSNDNGAGITVDGDGWRVDHCKFDNEIEKTIEGVIAWGTSDENGCPKGVIDHCEFNNIRVLVVGDAGLMANEIWSEPLGLGSKNAVFVEDCKFHYTKFGNVIDANYGGRYVFRYNDVVDAYIEAHSVQGENRAARSWEIYENTIKQVEQSMWTPFFLRGGTGVVYNNTVIGSWSSPTITVDNRRSFEFFEGSGACDGTSPWDGNEESNGYPARDQIGRSTDSCLWTDETPYPTQELSPFYQWNNKYNGSEIEVYVHNNCGIHIKENRDYYNNTEKPVYTPYTYPHPLTTGNR